MEIDPSTVPSEAFLPIHSAIGGRSEAPLPAHVSEMAQRSSFIFGRDVDSGRVFVFYAGKDLNREQEHHALAFDLDFDTDEVEWLVALCEVFCGRCDYDPSSFTRSNTRRLTVEPGEYE